MSKSFDSLSSDERKTKIEQWLRNLGGSWKGRYVQGLQNEVEHLRQRLAEQSGELRTQRDLARAWKAMSLGLANECEACYGACRVCEGTLRHTKDCPVHEIREAEKR